MLAITVKVLMTQVFSGTSPVLAPESQIGLIPTSAAGLISFSRLSPTIAMQETGFPSSFTIAGKNPGEPLLTPRLVY